MARSTLEDFVLKDKLGSGSYGVVYKVIRKIDRQTYALKEIVLNGMSRKEQEECIRETQVLSRLDSEHIIKYYDSFLEQGRLFIVTEYAQGGSLHDLIKRQEGPLPEQLVWRLFIQMVLGLNHMHVRKILHRDFKALNVFLDDKLNVKLGDMGVAKVLSTQTAFAQTIVGTPYYLSPELCEDKPYDDKSDVWALGVCLYECCTKHHPFDADNQAALVMKIIKGKYAPVTGYSKDLVAIIAGCLTLDPKKRLNTDKILAMKGLRDRAEQLGIPLPPLPAAPAGARTVNIGSSLPPSATSSPQSTGLVGGIATPPPGMVRKASGHLTASGSSAASSSGPLVEKSAGSASAAKAPGAGLVRPKSGSKPAESAAGPAAAAGRVPSRSPSHLSAAAAAKAAAPSAGKAGSAASSATNTPRGEEGIPAARGARVPSASRSSQEALGDISAALQQMQVGSRGV